MMRETRQGGGLVRETRTRAAARVRAKENQPRCNGEDILIVIKTKERVKYIGAIILFLGVIASCDKPKTEAETTEVDLTIISANTVATATQGQDIFSALRCIGSDLCYQFSHFEITQTKDREFDIRTKGTYPIMPIACPLAIYYKDTTLRIPAETKGMYILRFYNQTVLFESDTIPVN